MLPYCDLSSNGRDEACSPPPGVVGSSPSLVSPTVTGGGGATRVTSATGIRIAANNVAAAITLPAVAPGDTTPGRERFTAATMLPPSLVATRYRVGLQTSCTEAGAILNPGVPRPLTKIMDGVGVIPTRSCLAYGSLRSPARGSPTGAAGGASPDRESRIDRAPVRPSDRPDYSAAPTASRASSGHKLSGGTGPVTAQSPGRPSDRPARPATSATGSDGAGNAVEGRGDRARFTARSSATSALAARFLDTGTSVCRAASCSSPADVAVGSRRTAEVPTTSRLSSSEKAMSSRSVGSSDASFNSTSLARSPTLTRRATSFFFSSFR
ncbi:uncharacterized protein [Miscanthus floridulus]|uniref:uncharacterized protein n=1 Tax=Miscanthus floridulus TaxID=154761 RepID=UPI00345AA461